MKVSVHISEDSSDLRLLLRRSCQEVAPSTLRLRVITQISVLRSGGTPV